MCKFYINKVLMSLKFSIFSQIVILKHSLCKLDTLDNSAALCM